ARHEDQPAPTALAAATDDRANGNHRMTLVIPGDLDVDIVSQQTPSAGVTGQRMHGPQRRGWDKRPHPLDDIPVVVVVRRLDDLDKKLLTGCDGGRHPAILQMRAAMGPAESEVLG